jgi:hypothetical protein
VFRRAGREFYNALREHGFVYPQILLIVEDHVLPRGLRGKDVSADDIARRAKFGLIEVPDEDRARAELRCRKNQRVAEKRRSPTPELTRPWGLIAHSTRAIHPRTWKLDSPKFVGTAFSESTVDLLPGPYSIRHCLK